MTNFYHFFAFSQTVNAGSIRAYLISEGSGGSPLDNTREGQLIGIAVGSTLATLLLIMAVVFTCLVMNIRRKQMHGNATTDMSSTCDATSETSSGAFSMPTKQWYMPGARFMHRYVVFPYSYIP